MRRKPPRAARGRARLLALLPDIHGRPTGGNLFNRQVLACLESVAEVERRVVTRRAPIADGGADVTLLDSLLLTRHAAGAPRPRVLIAHYLHLFEPARRGAAEADAERRALPHLDGAVTTSRFCRQALVAEGLAAARVAAITPGLAPVYATAPPARPAGPPRILTVSTLLPGKGLRQLLELLEGLADLPWSWEIAGDPGLDPEFAAGFRRRVETSPVAGRVRMYGAVEPGRMIALYDRCHLFALPSRFESCSMATMEAMARALPVVAYRVGGLPERVPAASALLLATPGDHAAFAASLRRLLAGDEAAALGRANRLAARDFPSWESSAADLWRFLRGFVRQGDA